MIHVQKFKHSIVSNRKPPCVIWHPGSSLPLSHPPRLVSTQIPKFIFHADVKQHQTKPLEKAQETMYVLIRLKIYRSLLRKLKEAQTLIGLKGVPIYIILSSPRARDHEWYYGGVLVRSWSAIGISILHEDYTRFASAKQEFLGPLACLTCARSGWALAKLRAEIINGFPESIVSVYVSLPLHILFPCLEDPCFLRSVLSSVVNHFHSVEARKLDAILGFSSSSSHIYSLIKFYVLFPLIDLQTIFSLHLHSDAWVQVWYDSSPLVWLQLSPLCPLSLQFHLLVCSLHFCQAGQSLNHSLITLVHCFHTVAPTPTP